jgi:geranylgeranyl reductase family protein
MKADDLCMRTSHDVVIIGAGPAGCTAGEGLARAGFDVALVEEHAVVGEPVDCTGILGAEAFQRFDLPQRIVVGGIGAVTLHSPAGVPITHDAGEPFAFVVDRAELDRSLALRAQAAGTALYLNTRAVSVARNATGVAIGCRGADGGPRHFSAKVLILAGGPQFAFQEQLGLGASPLFWQSAHAELAGDGLPHPQVYLGRDVAPGAFAWAVPLRRFGRPFVRIGVNSSADAPRYLRRLCQEGFAHLMPVGERFNPRSWVVPIVPLARTYGERVLAVGDAAGQVKSTSGGGIYFGMLCAQIAAETVAGALRNGRVQSGALAAYEKRWRSALGRNLTLGSLLRRLFSRMPDSDVDRLFRSLQKEIRTGRLADKVSFDWHQELILFLLRHPTMVRLLLRGCWERDVGQALEQIGR